MTISRDPHPSETAILRFFESEHLPEPLKYIVRQCEYLSHTVVSMTESDPELTAGLRKLLEAKDCFVRAKVAEVNRSKSVEAQGKPL